MQIRSLKGNGRIEVGADPCKYNNIASKLIKCHHYYQYCNFIIGRINFTLIALE